MKKFTRLFEQLDRTFSTNEKISLMKDYFVESNAEDNAWALFFLSGQRLKRLISSRQMRNWCLEKIAIPDWLFQECYSTVGDTAEAISLLLPDNPDSGSTLALHQWMQERILPLRELSDIEQKTIVNQWWDQLSRTQNFILNKILTGSFRLGISELLTVRALEEAYAVPRALLLSRLQGTWQPTKSFFEELVHQGAELQKSHFQPYPFCLAHPLDKDLEELGNIRDWSIERKWDGIRAQLLFRDHAFQIWSRGNDLITHQFPELNLDVTPKPEGIVIDGEVLAYVDGLPLSFNVLQNRLGRKKLTPQILKTNPVVFMAFDMLEWEHKDIRHLPFQERRSLLVQWITSLPQGHRYLVSPSLAIETWQEAAEERMKSREILTEGLMLKKLDSPYVAGRKKGSWWKFKINPYTIDAVLMYAQPGSGIRANLYTDYTFGVWDGDVLTPIAKAYSGLTKEEIGKLDKWIRQNTEEKFGPVRQVKQVQVFELAFEGIQLSNRHKSGVAVRFPRISRWRFDKIASEADKLSDVKSLINA